MTCQKAQGFLDANAVAAAQTVDANKHKIGPQEALALLDGVRRLVALRGQAVADFDLANGRPDDETLLKHLIGPSGNLRAPTLRVGDTLVVGFNEEAYKRLLKTK